MKKPRKNVKSLLAIGAFIGVINNQTISEAMVRSILGVAPSAYMETVDSQWENRMMPAHSAIRSVIYEGDDGASERSIAPEAEPESEPHGSEMVESEVRVVNDAGTFAEDNGSSHVPESENESPDLDQPAEPASPEVPQVPETSEPQPIEEKPADTNEYDSSSDTNSNNNNNNNSDKKDQEKDEEPDPITVEPESSLDGEELESNFQFSVSRNLTTQQFINEIGPDAQDVAYQNNIYASVMIAQAILETGSGNSTLSSPPNHNLFGIKGSFRGQKVTFNTQEDDGSGNWYTISSNFRKYPSYRESIEDYARLLRGGISGNSSFYAPVWKENAATYREATAWLTGRYATDIHYDVKLNALIEAYDLTAFDNQPTEALLEQIDKTRSEKTNADKESLAKNQTNLFEELQRSSINRRGSGNLPASIRTTKDRLQENADANIYANQLKGNERAGSEVDAHE